MHWSLEPPFAISHTYSARSIVSRAGCVLPTPTGSCQRLPGDTPARTRGGSRNPLYLQGIAPTFWVPRCLQREGESEKLRRGAMPMADPVIDVDILGHLFEQSITNLERLRHRLETGEGTQRKWSLCRSLHCNSRD